MPSRKITIVKPGEGSGWEMPIPSGTSRDEVSDSDDEYMAKQLKNRRRQLPRTRDFKKFYYGVAPPAKPALDQIHAALRAFDKPIRNKEGTTEAVREKLFHRRANCVYCYQQPRSREEYLRHIASHEQVGAWLRFRDKARQDFEGMQARQAELKERIAGVRKDAAHANRIALRIAKEEAAMEKRLASEGQVDEDAMAMTETPLFGDDSFIAVRESTEFKALRARVAQAEEKVRRYENQLERLQVSLRALEKRTARFRRSADTCAIAAGEKDEIGGLLLESAEIYPVARYKMFYVPATNSFIESTGGSKY